MLASIRSRVAAKSPKTIGRSQQIAVADVVASRRQAVAEVPNSPKADRGENETSKKPKWTADAANAT